MKHYEDTVVAKSGKYGPLKWFGHSYNVPSKGAALLGRFAALYDHVMDTLTNMIIFTDPENRGKAMRRYGIWLESQPKRVRYMYSCICNDLPQVGKEAVMADDVTAEEVAYWYNWQKNALTDTAILRRVLTKVWGGDMDGMTADIGMPGSRMALMFTWRETMGSDVQYCLEGAFETLMQAHGGREAFLGADYDSRVDTETYEERKTAREAFTEGWRECESRLLEVAPEFRNEVWGNEDRR